MEEAARLIWESWNAGQVITHLPYHLIPNTRADAYEIQSYYEIFSGKPIFGWKIAATSNAGQQHIGVDGPIAGRLLHERVFDPDIPLLFGSNRMAVAEAEFAFRMKDTLISRVEEYSKSEVMLAVDTLHSAIEIPNSRFKDFSKMGDKQLIVDNACAHELVIGPAMCDSWRRIDLSKHQVLISVGEQCPQEGSGSNVLGDPRIALTWLVNELSTNGINLRAGEMVTTGTCVTPIKIQPGDEVTADYGALGLLKMSFLIDS